MKPRSGETLDRHAGKQAGGDLCSVQEGTTATDVGGGIPSKARQANYHLTCY